MSVTKQGDAGPLGKNAMYGQGVVAGIERKGVGLGHLHSLLEECTLWPQTSSEGLNYPPPEAGNSGKPGWLMDWDRAMTFPQRSVGWSSL